MTLHWTERSTTVVRIGLELQRRGWTLCGYSPDQSQAQCDYYCPAHWEGIATHPAHPEVVVGVDISDYQAQNNSGKDDWPMFHATPKGRTWHVERGGQIAATGVGLQKCAGYNGNGWAKAVANVVDQIEHAVRSSPAGSAASQPNGEPSAGNLTFRVQPERGWTWIYFSTKPAEAVREAIKTACGARFGKRRMAWYITRQVEAAEIEKVIAATMGQAAGTETAGREAVAQNDGSTQCMPQEETMNGSQPIQTGQKQGAHHLLPQEMCDKIPKLYTTEKVESPTAWIKLFTPDSSWTWYVVEFDGEDTCFGLVVGLETEIGYFSLSEMQEVRGPLGLRIERDLWFNPTPVADLRDYQQKWGDGGPYKRAGAQVSPEPAQLPATAQPEREQRSVALQRAAELRRDPGLPQYLVGMNEVDTLPFHLRPDGTLVESLIRVYCVGREVELETGEVVTISGFFTAAGEQYIEVLQSGEHMLPPDTNYQPDHAGTEDCQQERCIWKKCVRGVLLDERQLAELSQEIPTLANLAQRWLPAGGTPASLPDRWTVEDIRFLLTKLDEGPILVADTKLGLPTIHDHFGAEAQHCGYGLFKVCGPGYKLYFDGGGAMGRTPSEQGWTHLHIDEGMYPYDTEAVRRKLLAYLPAETPAVQPASQIPAPIDRTDTGHRGVEAKPAPTLPVLSQSRPKNSILDLEAELFGDAVDEPDPEPPAAAPPSELAPTPIPETPLLIAAEEAAPKPIPEALPPSEPWEISRLAYQMDRAQVVSGGIPILNGADGEAHRQTVIAALQAGKPVPAYVLADYPDLARAETVPGSVLTPEEPQPSAAESVDRPEVGQSGTEDSRAPLSTPVFQQQLTGEAVGEFLQQVAARVPAMSGVDNGGFYLKPVTPAEQWTAEERAEFEQWELELLTGQTSGKQGPFFAALQHINRPGTLQLALTRVNGDHRRRAAIENRLKTLAAAGG